MTWVTAKERLIALIQDVPAASRSGDYGTEYKHDASLDREEAAGDGRLFFIECTEVETVDGNYIQGHEWTRADVDVGVWVPFNPANPSDFDDVIWTIYEELREPLLLQGNWDRPTSTLVSVQGPGDGANVLGEREDVLGDEGNIIGAWLMLRLSVLHEEQGS